MPLGRSPILRHYGQTFGGWQDSATRGCQLCAMRWSRLSPNEKEDLSSFMYRIEPTFSPGARFSGNPYLSFAYLVQHDGPSHYPYLRHDFTLIALDSELLRCGAIRALYKIPC